MDITNEDSENISLWENDEEELPRPETVTVVQDELENSDPCLMHNSDPLSVDPLSEEQINKLSEPTKKKQGHEPKVIIKIEISDSDGETFDAPSRHVLDDDGYRSDSDEGTTSRNKSKTSHLNDARSKSNEVAAKEVTEGISEKINTEVEIGISANDTILEAERRPQCSGVSETQRTVRTSADRSGPDVESALLGRALVCESEMKDSQTLHKRAMRARRYAPYSGPKWSPPKERSAKDAKLLPSIIVKRSVRVVIARCMEAEKLVAPMVLARQCSSGRKTNNVARALQSGSKKVDGNIMNSMENSEIEVTEKIPKFIISKTAKSKLKSSERTKVVDEVPFSSHSGLSEVSREESLDGKQEQNFSVERDQLENHQRVGRSVSITRESLLDVSNQDAVFRLWSCSICHKGFNNPKAMSGHTRHCKRKLEMENILPFNGKGNGKNLSCEATLLRPTVTHEVNLKYKCHICGEKFVDLSNLKKHSQLHSADHTYTCEVCEQIFSSEESLKLHETEVGHTKDFMKHENRLSIHTNSQKQNHKCGLCGMSFGAPNGLKTHKCSFIKPNMSKNILQSANSFDKYSCFRIGRGLKVTIKRSTTKYTSSIKFFCRICMKVFLTSSALKTHMHQHTGKPTQCPVCDKTVSCPYRLQEHIRAWHTFERPYQCNLCDRAYPGANSLRLHKKFKHKLKAAMQMKPCPSAGFEKCDIKLDKLVQKENGKSDFKYRPKENMQKCNLCSAILSSASLKKHNRRFHTKQKSGRYKCEHCQASFNSVASLHKHIAYHARSRQDMSALKSLSHKKPDQNCARDRKDLQVTVNSPAAESTSERKYCCIICKTTFLNLDDWKVHRTLHSGNRCHLCGKTFSLTRRLKDHILSLHSNERPYQCNLCDKAYGSSDTLRVHKKKKHNLKSYSILNSCSTAITNKSDIMHDQLVQKGKKKKEKSNFKYQFKEKIHKCDECCRSFSTHGYLMRHNNRYHLQETKKESLELYKCEQCKASFYSIDALSQHDSRFHSGNIKGISEIKSCSKEKPYQCTYCKVSYSNQIYLLKHLSKNHWEKEKEIGKSYKCNMCSITFSKSALLHRHKLSFHSDKSGGFECNECKSVFMCRPTLLRHARRYHPEKVKDLLSSYPHSKRKRYKCNKCNGIFNLHSAWLKHTCYFHLLSRMEGSKNKACTSRMYQCHLCSKMLSRNDGLRRHIREVHFKVKGKQKPFDIGPHSSGEIHKCNKCNATFNLAAAVYNHKCYQTKEIEETAALSSLTNGQIFKCDVCNVVFNQPSSLLEHTVNFHEEVTKKAFPTDVHKDKKFYKCDLCPAKYNGRKWLLNHKTKYHLEEQSYQCSVCLKSFSSPIVLIKHHETHLKKLISSAPPGESASTLEDHILTHSDATFR